MQEKTVKKDKEKAFAQISKNSFLLVVILLSAIIILSGVLSYVVPQGSYERDDNGMIIDGTFTEGEVDGIAIWRVITAPVRVFFSGDAVTIIMISVFLLIMSGIFNLIEKTGGVKVIIERTVGKFSTRKKLVVILTTLVFMAFGSLFGMFEELVTLLPIVLVFALSLKYDTLTGLGVCLLAPCFGFTAAITNPFSVGIASNLAGTQVFDGVWLRLVFFVLVFGAVSLFLYLHMRKISKCPEKSLTFEIDQEKRASIGGTQSEGGEKDKKLFRTYVVFFGIQLVVLVAIASIRALSSFAIPLLAVSFLVGGIVSGLIVTDKKSDVFKHILKGAAAMLPAVVMIAFASSVKLIMEESGILDTVMHAVIVMLTGKSKFLCVVLIYVLILFIQIFIGSSSAKVMLIMPIILPIAATLGLSPTIVILTYCMADGFTDVFLPTNPILLVGLSVANVSYGKWIKWTWKFQLLMFLGTLALLFFAVQIGY